jgi:hypothetical protein
MRGSWVWMYAAMMVCGCATAAPIDAPTTQPASNLPGPAVPMPGELPDLLLLRGRVDVGVPRVAAGVAAEVYLTLNEPAAGPMQILVQLEGEWPGAARVFSIADGTVKATKDEGVAVIDTVSGETLLFWLTEPFRDAASTAPGAGHITPIQAYGWSAFWDYGTTVASGVLPKAKKYPDYVHCAAGGPGADRCSVGGCPEPPTQCAVGGCVGQSCTCCGCDPFACCRCVRPCWG